MVDTAETVEAQSRALLKTLRETSAADYTPIADRVLVRRLDESTMEERDSGLVVVQRESDTKTGKAVVVAVGPGRVKGGKRIAPSVAPGDVILTGKYLGHSLEIDGVAYSLVKDGDILAIIGGA